MQTYTIYFPEPEAPPVSMPSVAYHYLHDVLGSVIGLVDDAGELVGQYTYDPYGKVFIENWDAAANGGNGAWLASAEPTSGMPVSSVGNSFMWTGHRYDAAVGLYATHFRTYSPTVGRWLQRDPLEYVDGLSMYEYSQSTPIKLIDRLGLSCWEDCIRVHYDDNANAIADLTRERDIVSEIQTHCAETCAEIEIEEDNNPDLKKERQLKRDIQRRREQREGKRRRPWVIPKSGKCQVEAAKSAIKSHQQNRRNLSTCINGPEKPKDMSAEDIADLAGQWKNHLEHNPVELARELTGKLKCYYDYKTEEAKINEWKDKELKRCREQDRCPEGK